MQTQVLNLYVVALVALGSALVYGLGMVLGVAGGLQLAQGRRARALAVILPGLVLLPLATVMAVTWWAQSCCLPGR